MQDHLDAELLRTLVAIADTGSFAEAARSVHRTQSAVSMQMKRLEGVVGRPLFEKRGRRTLPNAGGRDLLHRARQILALQDEALAAFREPGLHGEVRMGACDDYVLSFVPPILARYADAHPRVHVRLDARSSTALVASAAAGEIDIALVNVVDEAVRHEKLTTEPLVWVGSASHEAHAKDPLPLAIENECVWGRWAHDALDRIGRPYRSAYSAFNNSGLVAIVEAGLAVSVMSAGSVPASLRVLGEADGFPTLPITSMGMVVRGGPLSAAADAMVELLREELGRDAVAA